MIQPRSTDSILDEIHRTRRQIAEQFSGNIGAILEDARRRQAAEGRPIWRRDSTKTQAPSGDTVQKQ